MYSHFLTIFWRSSTFTFSIYHIHKARRSLNSVWISRFYLIQYSLLLFFKLLLFSCLDALYIFSKICSCGTELLCFFAHSNDGDFLYFVSLLDLVYNILSFYHMTKNRMLSIKPWCRNMSNKELATICSRACISH